MLRKLSRTMATVVALSALVMVSQAGAADKLVVKGTDGTTNKFVVDDTGAVTASGNVIAPKLGLGTTNPLTTFHNAEQSTSASRGVLVAQHNDGAQAANILFRKSRGTEASPIVPILGDYIGIFTAQYWNGVSYDRPAQFGFRSDAAGYAGQTAGTTTMPNMIVFFTGASTQAGDPNIMTERARISSQGNVVVGNSGGVATADLATNASNGFLYIPSVSGALTSCASVSTYTGHVPVWFDTANSKICTCQAGALKCTAALN